MDIDKELETLLLLRQKEDAKPIKDYIDDTLTFCQKVNQLKKMINKAKEQKENESRK